MTTSSTTNPTPVLYDDETYESLAHKCPDLSGWSVLALLTEYGDIAVRRRDAIAADAPELFEVESDLAVIAHEIEQRVTPGTRDRAAVNTLRLIRSGLEDLLEDAGGQA